MAGRAGCGWTMRAVFAERANEFVSRCDILLLDPPRQGLRTDISHLIPRKVSRIVYVSCSPAELAQDANKLKSLGFNLAELECIDMFPQTRHIESLAVFQKNLVN